jgi:hypothetical protein
VGPAHGTVHYPRKGTPVGASLIRQLAVQGTSEYVAEAISRINRGTAGSFRVPRPQVLKIVILAVVKSSFNSMILIQCSKNKDVLEATRRSDMRPVAPARGKPLATDNVN